MIWQILCKLIQTSAQSIWNLTWQNYEGPKDFAYPRLNIIFKLSEWRHGETIRETDLSVSSCRTKVGLDSWKIEGHSAESSSDHLRWKAATLYNSYWEPLLAYMGLGSELNLLRCSMSEMEFHFPTDLLPLSSVLSPRGALFKEWLFPEWYNILH